MNSRVRLKNYLNRLLKAISIYKFIHQKCGMTNITEKDTILLTNSRIRKETPSPMGLGCKKIKNLKDIIQYKEED